MARVISDDGDEEDKPLVRATGFNDIDEERALNSAHGVPTGVVNEYDFGEGFPANCVYNVSGVKALPAQARISWFRMNCSDWGTESEIVSMTDTHVIMKSTIRCPAGRLRATGLKRWPLLEKKRNSDFAIENAETSSLARAVSNLGYDTRKALSKQYRNWHPDEGNRTKE